MSLFIPPVVRATDANNLALSGAKWYFYASGGLTPASVYTTSALSTAHANPVVADSGGLFAPIYLDPAVSYRAVLKTSADSTIQDIDPYTPGTGVTATREGSTPFTEGTYYSDAQFLTNGADPAAWYSDQQGGENATEAFTGAIVVPLDATNHQSNAVSGYVRSDRAQPANGGDVAGYFQAVSNATDSAVFPLNTVGSDTSGKTGQILGNEFDYNVSAADTDVNGVNATIVANTALTGSRIAFAARGVFSANSQWSHGYLTADGSIEQYAMFIGATSDTTLTNRDSQPIALTSYKSDNTRYIATILGDHLGGIAFRPGSAAGSVAFQDTTGATNWFQVAVNGAGYPVGMGGAVTQITSKSTNVTLNKVSGQVTMNNAALASAAKVSFAVADSMVAATDTIIANMASGGTANAYRVAVTAVTAGAFTLTVENITAGSLSEAPVINFTVLKGANS